MESAQTIRTQPSIFDSVVQDELLGRLQTLRRVSIENGNSSDFSRVLAEVDAALKRYEEGTYGICETCQEPMSVDTMLADPLARVCLDELTGKQKAALEDDLQFAAQIQRGFLPQRDLAHGRWRVDYVYEPAGIISGDYCDVIPSGDDLYFILGDVSGKGMAASLLMSNLHAIFHSLIPLDLDLAELMTRANRLLLKSSLDSQFATLVIGKAGPNGDVATVNAGHLPPMLIKGGERTEIDLAGLPLGMFCEAEFESQSVKLDAGDSLLFFTDGVTETVNQDGDEFGTARLGDSVAGRTFSVPAELIARCAGEIAGFRGQAERHDDLTMLAVTFA